MTREAIRPAAGTATPLSTSLPRRRPLPTPKTRLRIAASTFSIILLPLRAAARRVRVCDTRAGSRLDVHALDAVFRRTRTILARSWGAYALDTCALRNQSAQGINGRSISHSASSSLPRRSPLRNRRRTVKWSRPRSRRAEGFVFRRCGGEAVPRSGSAPASRY